MRLSTGCLWAAALTATTVSSARAEEEEAPHGDEPLSIAGRVFVRADALSIESEPWEGELSLESARLGANYRWKEKARVKVVIEAAGKVEAKDAFVELRPSACLVLRAGRQKLPISALENESAWALPTIGRGVAADVLEHGIALTGRRDGIEATWTAGDDGPRLIAAVSQSVSTAGDDPARALADGGGLAATVRGEVDVGAGVRVGVVGSSREVIDGSTARRYWAAGVDAELDLDDDGIPLRVWADVLVGDSHLGTLSLGKESTGFAIAQIAGGWRFGGAKRNKRYVEPFVLGAFVNPSWDRTRDDVTEVIGGVAAGRWKRWRAQGQVAVVNARGLRPAGLGGALVDINDSIGVTLQLGAAF